MSGAFSSLVEVPRLRARGQCYCMTWNNAPRLLDVASEMKFPDELYDAETMSYMVAGREVGESGTPHYQMFVKYKKKISLSTVIKKWPGCHVESMRGTALQAIAYCKKEGDWKEYGTVPVGSGSRSDLSEYAARISNGEITADDILVDNFEVGHQYYRSFLRLQVLRENSSRRDWAPKVFWLYGPTGTGKSRAVHTEEPDDLYIYPYESNKWWDTYNGNEAVLFDDFRAQLPLNDILRITDRYAMSVAQRGRQPAQLLARRIYFTSCSRPEDIYSDTTLGRGDSLDQLLRRITKIIFVGASGIEWNDPKIFE